MSQTEPASDEFDDLLERNSFRRTLRICAWMNRFIYNSRRPEKRVGPIATEEGLLVTSPVPGLLPNDRTNPGAAFEVVGIDFAGPVRYRKSAKSEGKAYLAMFACSLSRAIQLELAQNLARRHSSCA